MASAGGPFPPPSRSQLITGGRPAQVGRKEGHGEKPEPLGAERRGYLTRGSVIEEGLE